MSITVILPDDGKGSIERDFKIIIALQTQVGAPLSAGVYDGRKNFFSPIDLEFETDVREVGPLSRSLIRQLDTLPVLQYHDVVLMAPSSVEGRRPPKKFTVRLTHVASINPECALFRSY